MPQSRNSKYRHPGKSRASGRNCVRFSGGSFIGVCDYENKINFICTSNATSVVNRSSGNTINIGLHPSAREV